MSFALALSGGGCRGAAHVGVLQALEEQGLRPAAVAGASAGAMVAGLYAYGLNPAALEALCLHLERHGRRYLDFDLLGLLRMPLQLALSREVSISGLLRGRRLRALLCRLTGEAPLSQAPLPCALAAADLTTGDTVAFSQQHAARPLPGVRWQQEARLCDAIYASCCVPAVFSPHSQPGGGLLVDGGVTDNLPVDLLLAMGHKTVVAVDISQRYAPVECECLFDIASHSLSLMSHRLQSCTVRGERLLIRPILPEEAGLFSFALMDQCRMAGYRAAKELCPLIVTLAQEK